MLQHLTTYSIGRLVNEKKSMEKIKKLIGIMSGSKENMSKYIVHIGAGKTGSSTIQNFLRLNSEALLNHGFYVPGSDLGNGKMTGEHVWATQKLLGESDPNSAIRKALLSMRDTAPEATTTLISAENLSNLGNARAFIGALPNDNCKVIIYIRRQDELLMSAWQQWHSKVEPDMHAWIVKALMQYGHWDRVINEWADVVGKSNIIVRVFDKADFIDGDLISDYCHCIGLRKGADGVDFNVPSANVSYNDFITDLVTGASGLFNGAHDNDFYNVMKKFARESMHSSAKTSLISRDMRESIVYFYRSANNVVCREYFKGRPQLFPAINHAKYDYLPNSDITKLQLQFLTQAMYNLCKKG